MSCSRVAFSIRLVLCLAALPALFGAAVAVAQGNPGPSLEDLRGRIARAAASPPGNATVSIAVADAVTGTEIYAKSPDKALNPASNVKIVTAACALKLLGPEFRFVTSLHGRRDGSAIRGPLYIKGHADPSLTSEDLWSMVKELRDAGVRRVESGIVVDAAYFDAENLPYAYDQQPNEDAAFRAPVGAVSLNNNKLAITIRPGPQAMRPARVIVEPPEYAVVVNDTLTTGEGAHNPKISAQSFEERTRLRVWGQIPLGSKPVTYYRRTDNPSLHSGHGLKGALEAAGITVGGGVQLGPLPSGTPLLAQHRSAPLSAILWETGKMSNNFVTEMVLKTIGAEAAEGPGTWDDATSRVIELLGEWGLEEGAYTYRNGSGLFGANAFSARQLVQVLRAAYADSTIRPEFVFQLATGGVDGTIRTRYQGRAARRFVRAKTGTLADVSALSGYVFDRQGQRPIAFSILVNDAPGYVSASRAYQEKIVTAIAEFLNP